MDQMRKDRLIEAGVDVNQALERFLGSEAMLERFLGKFLSDTNYPKLCQAVEAQDWEGALTAAHTLKGMCGNLSMNRLFSLFTRQVSALRGGDLAGAKALMEEIVPAYDAAAAAIQGDAL